jgi:hypothetical protein
MKIKFQTDEDLDVLTVRGLGVPGPNIDIRTAAAAEIAGRKDPDVVRNEFGGQRWSAVGGQEAPKTRQSGPTLET